MHWGGDGCCGGGSVCCGSGNGVWCPSVDGSVCDDGSSNGGADVLLVAAARKWKDVQTANGGAVSSHCSVLC